jgi:alkylation response protein AidB-like acyl-CoA dehydrogenase
MGMNRRSSLFNVLKEMGKLGMMGVLVPEKYGGAGLSYFEYKNYH